MYIILDKNINYFQSSAILTVAIECNIDGNWKAYQGIINNAEDDITEDHIQYIAGRGTKLRRHLACAYFPKLKPEGCECPS
jgi:hypothetical protein